MAETRSQKKQRKFGMPSYACHPGRRLVRNVFGRVVNNSRLDRVDKARLSLECETSFMARWPSSQLSLPFLIEKTVIGKGAKIDLSVF